MTTTCALPEPATRPAAPGRPDQSTGAALAGWRRRVLARLVDRFAPYVAWLLAAPSFADPRTRDAAVFVGAALHALLWVANRWGLQGATGRSLGKVLLGLLLVDARTRAVPGVLRTAARDVAHLLDYLVLYLGFFMPLIDERKQTIADKVVGTVVVRR